jgi:hypothetical protein
MSNQNPFDWAFWFQWMLATAAAWVIGRLLFPSLATVTIGLAIGILQWFLLKSRILDAWWWIVASAFGWALGSFLVLLLIPEELDVFASLIIGLSMGSAQWIVLSRFTYRSGWWIVVNIIAWTTGMALFPGIVLTGVMAGLITATAVAFMFKNPKPQEFPSGKS